jgi:ATP-dependent Lon protease
MLGFRLLSPKQYPVLPLRDIVVFPHMIVPLVCWAREIG